MIPEESLLIPFFLDASRRLEDCKISNPCTTEEIRLLLLSLQTDCLELAVSRHNESNRTSTSEPRGRSTTERPVDSSSRVAASAMTVVPESVTLQQAQRELRSQLPSYSRKVRNAMEVLNETARQTYCRLILYSECLHLAHNSANEACCQNRDHSGSDSNRGRSVPLRTSGPMRRDEILDFIGLCEVAVRLPSVQRYLSVGNRFGSGSNSNLFPDLPLPPTSVLPQKRLEFVQRLLLRGMGYDSSHGYREIRRLFFATTGRTGADGDRSDHPSFDPALAVRFARMSARMDQALALATIRATNDIASLVGSVGGDADLPSLSDHDQGGFTRVVSVSHSEKVIDPATGAELSKVEQDQAWPSTMHLPPSSERMELQHRHSAIDPSNVVDHQDRRNVIAQQTSEIHQEILGELLTMRDEDREVKLEKARELEGDMLRHVSRLENPADRVSYLRGLDETTHRLLLMGKIWASMLQQNSGQPPKLR